MTIVLSKGVKKINIIQVKGVGQVNFVEFENMQKGKIYTALPLGNV